MTRRFNKIGLRRDRNFSDLTNPEQALNNILNGLVDVPEESFISDDLDAIRDISATTITNEDFVKISGAALKVNDVNAGSITYKPIVKIKNRLDIARFTTGEPNFFGGDGLTNRYYNSSRLSPTAALVKDIFTNSIDVNGNIIDDSNTPKEVYWERGLFSFVSKIHPTFGDAFGGIMFNGYFRPTESGRWRFNFFTTGYVTLEFDDGSGNLVLHHRKTQRDVTLSVNAAVVGGAGSSGSNILQLTNVADVQNIFIRDIISHPTIAQFADKSGDNYIGAITVLDFNRNAGTVTISEPLAADIPAGTQLTFRYLAGQTDGSFDYITPNIEEFKPYRIRIRVLFPQEQDGISANSVKRMDVGLTPPSLIQTRLNYKWLYSEDYNVNPTLGTTDFGDFREFYINRITSGGGTIGSNTYSTYNGVVTKSPLFITYSPPISIADITDQTKTVALVNGTNAVAVELTDGIAVGQYVFGNGFAQGTRVKDVSINSGVFMTTNATINGASTLRFIDHRGLVAYQTTPTVSTTNGNKTVTLSADVYNAISTGDIVIASNLPQYTIVTRKGATNSITLSDAPTSTASVEMFFYKSAGITYSNTTTAFCTDVVAAPTVATSLTGANTLTLAYVDGIANGDVAQFSNRIAAGTTVTNVNGTTKVVTLSTNLLNEIPTGQLVTFAPAATTENKEICFPPIDTSLPFNATTLGLTTTTNEPSISIVPLAGATGAIKFAKLSADSVVVATTTPTATYDRGVRIKVGSDNANLQEFRILATT